VTGHSGDRSNGELATVRRVFLGAEFRFIGNHYGVDLSLF